MQKPLISIIIPVYNSQKFISRCLNSINNQSYKNIEVTIINDGSTDNSVDEINKFADQTSLKINIYNQQNKGSGIARSNGIKHINGEYFTFVDIDDALKPNAIENFVKYLDADTDVIISGFESISESCNKKILHLPKKNDLWTQLKYPCTAFKLYKTNYVIKNKFKFDSTKLLEDVTFNLQVFSFSNKIKVLSETNYINYLNEDSQTANLSRTSISDISQSLYSIESKCRTNKYPKDMMMFFYVKTAVQNIIMQVKLFNTKTLSKLFNKYWNIINKNYKIKVYKQKGESSQINFIVKCFIIAKKTHTLKMLIAVLKKLNLNN